MKTEGEEDRDSGGQAPFLKPKIAEIAKMIANDGMIHTGETKSQRAAADNAKHYTKIEKELHGNKDAAKAVRRLLKMDQSHRDDFMRTFEPLCGHLNLWPPEDLVDKAQGKGDVILSGGDRGRPVAVAQTAGVDYEPESGGDASDAGDDDDAEAGVGDVVPDSAIPDPIGEAQAAPLGDNVTPFRSALDRSREHFGKGNDPEPTAPKPGRKPRAPRKGTEAVH